MTEPETLEEVQVSSNGHLPSGVTWTKALDVLVGSDDHQIFVNGLGMALAESGNQCIFQPNIQQRCAQVRCLAPAIYHGQVLELISASLPQRWRDWDRTIDTLCLAMAELDMQPLSEVNPEEIVWLWDPYIPLKKLTLVEGDPSSGKTYLLLAIAAAVTAGHALPDQVGKVAPPTPDRGNVLYITAEDGIADTIRPRAEKVGADLTRLFVPRNPQSFSLADPAILSNAMRRYTPRLVVLDPLQAFLGAGIDMHRANEVRPLMTTLLALAIEHTCAIVAIRHWTKAPGDVRSIAGRAMWISLRQRGVPYQLANPRKMRACALWLTRSHRSPRPGCRLSSAFRMRDCNGAEPRRLLRMSSARRNRTNIIISARMQWNG